MCFGTQVKHRLPILTQNISPISPKVGKYKLETSDPSNSVYYMKVLMLDTGSVIEFPQASLA